MGVVGLAVTASLRASREHDWLPGGCGSGLAHYVPTVGWLPRYERRWLRRDLTAGVAVTALVVPKNVGHAGIAGVPLQKFLYDAVAGAIIYALLCTSRQISTGPSSWVAAVARARPRAATLRE